jgi:hypothetical protein
MPTQATVIRVMIASPGDVANERRIAKEVIDEWNAIHSADRATVLLPVMWETHASPAMGDRAQSIINEQIVSDADIVIGIFWTRIGTPTGVAPSGTVEEINVHIKAKKATMLYFSTQPVRLDSLDEVQYNALKEFKHSLRVENHGLVAEYESLSEFKEKLMRQLAQTVIREYPRTPEKKRRSYPAEHANAKGQEDGLQGHGYLNPAHSIANELKRSSPFTRAYEEGVSRDDLINDVPPATQPSISTEARQLLLEASRDPHGVVLHVTTFEGTTIETNGKNFTDPGNPRSVAKWKSSLDELTSNGLLAQKDRRGEVFSVTGDGFRVADYSS